MEPLHQQNAAHLVCGRDRYAGDHPKIGNPLVLNAGYQSYIDFPGSQALGAFCRRVGHDLKVVFRGPMQEIPSQRRGVKEAD